MPPAVSGWVEIASKAVHSKPAHKLVGEIHEWNGWTIIVVAAGHAAAALYHHYVLHERVLARMLPLVERDPGRRG